MLSEHARRNCEGGEGCAGPRAGSTGAVKRRKREEEGRAERAEGFQRWRKESRWKREVVRAEDERNWPGDETAPTGREDSLHRSGTHMAYGIDNKIMPRSSR
ncbi:hypothetical protein K0M31_002161 [Melipona bicolor]|uniref:Uncharacterized protein n=1 Tax=Melipona bicolor TaxID=60889 RepID=A0AA40GH19_9HYME|nr:hypothetical protein K0M31_002161 [Melipona bicolor]